MKREGHFHLHVAPVYKSRGQSAVASAAYNANQKLTHKAQRLTTISADHSRKLNKGIITDKLRQELKESPVFTVKADGMDQLAAGAIPDSLRGAFEQQDMPLSNRCQVRQTREGITLYDKDQKLTWHLYQQGDALTVCRYHGITLSQQATVTKDKRDNWTIEDKDNVFYKVRLGRERKTNEKTGERKYTGHKWIDVYGDKVHDYTDKADVVETWVQAPQHAPEWIKTLADTGKIRKEERERLWNFAEDHENGRDERPAMKIELALLRELTLEQNRQAVRDFVDEYFTSRGIIADVAIHSKMASDDKPNTHCHMLFFTREAMPGGKLNSDKNPYWTSKHRVVDWRKGWEQIANQALEDAGSDVRIDHRSHKARGLNKVPGIHLGPTAVAMEDKDVETARGDHNREVREENHNRVSVEQVPHADLNPWDMDHGDDREPQGTAFTVRIDEDEASSSGQPAGWQQPASETPEARQMRQDEGFVRMMLDRTVQASLRFVRRLQEVSRAGQFWTRPALAQPGHEPEMSRKFTSMINQQRERERGYER